MYYQRRIIDARMDSKKIWNILNGLMGKRNRSTPSFLEADGYIITKPAEIANYLSYFFKDKIQKLQNSIDTRKGKDCISSKLIKGKIMKDKQCCFRFDAITEDAVEKLLQTAKETPSGIDNLDIKLLKSVAGFIALPIAFIINLSFKKGIFPAEWKIAKITPLPKDSKDVFSGKNSRPISLLPALSKVMERIVYEQIQGYFFNNNLNTVFQHAYKRGTSTALTQMTDDWLRDMEIQKIIGTILLDFSAAFDILDHSLIEKVELLCI